MSTQYSLRVIRVHGLQWKLRFHRSVPDLYVEARLDNDVVRRTRTIKKSLSPEWDERLVVSSSDEFATLNIQVKHDSIFPPHPSAGVVDIMLADLLTQCASGEVTIPLRSMNSANTEPTGHIVLHLEIVDSFTGADISLTRASEDIRQSGIRHAEGISDVMQSVGNKVHQVSEQGDLYQAIGELLGRLRVFHQAVDALSEIHPFITVAWKLTSMLYSAIEHTYNTDKKIIELVRTMCDAFSFVRDVHALPDKATRLQEAISGLLKQTIECCLFVSRYTSRGFLKRMMDLGSHEKIDEFDRALGRFKQQIESGVIPHTAIVSMRTPKGIDDLVFRQRLNPSNFDAFDRPMCLPKTRVEIRREIIDWVFSDTKQTIFWLHGVAGSGKSTIATTIARHFRQMSRLGAFLFFERGKSEPSSVIRTIAYKLALHDPSIGSSILSEVDNDKDIGSAPASDQFERLLLQPLTGSSMTGPTIIMLDALDECGNPETRRGLLGLLTGDFPKLPSAFRFVITSRREPDIDKALSSITESVHQSELDFTSADSKEDVHSYLRIEMQSAVRDEVNIADGWPWDENIALLARAAGGLFIWASTAVKMVRNSDEPFHELDCLTSDSKSLVGFGLRDLYATVLRNSGIKWDSERSRERFRKVLVLILLGKKPLSSGVIDGILGFAPHESSLLILSKLRSLLTYSEGGPVSFLHASFPDYLTAPEYQPEKWSIDIPSATGFIADRCFDIMESSLRFNICDLGTSFVRNDDVAELAGQVRTRIPEHLEYSCFHWSRHLDDAPYSHDLLERLTDFSRLRVLFWFEVLSLLKTFSRMAARMLFDAATWIEPHSAELASFLRDGGECAAMFIVPIMRSTPHIYISMIPITKDKSKFSDHYSKQLSSLVHIVRRGTKGGLICLRVLEGHCGSVYSTAFSTDGLRAVSASIDGTIRIWDIGGGGEDFSLSTEHPTAFFSVAFAPHGRHIAAGSGDGSLRVWDARNGDLVLGPLIGHSGAIESIAFSPDGTKIVSGSTDRVIIIWNAVDGCPVGKPFIGHADSVCSISFSPDGTLLGSGSHDKTVRIWDTRSHGPFLAPLEGHTSWVWSISFSPDGKYISSGSEDGTIRVWEVESGRIVSTFTHGMAIYSISYSSCGTYLVTGSDDKMVTIRDAKSGRVISDSLEGHLSGVYCVAFSPNGKYIVSGSGDSTVRIWDTSTTAVEPKSFSGHIGKVTRCACSASGNLIATASEGELVIVWDAYSGNVIAQHHLNHMGEIDCLGFSLDNLRVIWASSDRIVVMWDIETGRIVSNRLEGCTDRSVDPPFLKQDVAEVAPVSRKKEIGSSGAYLLRDGSKIAFSGARLNAIVTPTALSPNGTKVACGSRQGTIKVWDVATGQLIVELCHSYEVDVHGFAIPVSAVAFSPDGKHLVSGSESGSIVIWNTENWQRLSAPTIRCPEVKSIWFSSDGARFATYASYNHSSIMIWDTASALVVDTGGSFEGSWEDTPFSVIFSPSHRTAAFVVLVSKSSGTRILSVCAGSDPSRCTCEFKFETTGSPRIALSSDGSTLVSYRHDDNMVRVWDTSALRCSASEQGGSTEITPGCSDEPEWILGEAGWILGGHGRRNLLFWIPPDLRPTLCKYRNTAILNCEFSTRLDFTGAALGDRWMECYTPSSQAQAGPGP